MPRTNSCGGTNVERPRAVATLSCPTAYPCLKLHTYVYYIICIYMNIYTYSMGFRHFEICYISHVPYRVVRRCI